MNANCEWIVFIKMLHMFSCSLSHTGSRSLCVHDCMHVSITHHLAYWSGLIFGTIDTHLTRNTKTWGLLVILSSFHFGCHWKSPFASNESTIFYNEVPNPVFNWLQCEHIFIPLIVFMYRCVDMRRSMAAVTLRRLWTSHHVTVELGRTAALAATVLTSASSR